jgi:quinol monooxygenase YgiN
MIERYQDQESLKLHGSSKPFTEFQKKLKELDLMRAPMTLKMVSEQGG